jgi:hypothetical protein
MLTAVLKKLLKKHTGYFKLRRAIFVKIGKNSGIPTK